MPWIDDAKNKGLKDVEIRSERERYREELFRNTISLTIDEIEQVLAKAKTEGLLVSEARFTFDRALKYEAPAPGNFKLPGDRCIILGSDIAYFLLWKVTIPDEIAPKKMQNYDPGRKEKTLEIKVGIETKNGTSLATNNAVNVECDIKRWLNHVFSYWTI